MAVDQVRQRRQPGRQAAVRPGGEAQPASREQRRRGLEEQLRRLPPARLAELAAALAAVHGPDADDDRMIASFEQGVRSAQYDDDNVEAELDDAYREGYAEGVREGARLADDLKRELRAAQERVSELETQLGEMEAREAELAGRERQESRRGEGRAPSERDRGGAGGS